MRRTAPILTLLALAAAAAAAQAAAGPGGASAHRGASAGRGRRLAPPRRRAAWAIWRRAPRPTCVRVLAPPPVEGDSRDAADLTVFRDTRRLEGTPRWAMAQRDNALGTPALLQAFSCALDAVIAPAEAPTLVRLLAQSGFDAGGWRPRSARTRGAASGPSSARAGAGVPRPRRGRSGWRAPAPTIRRATRPRRGWPAVCWPRWRPIVPRRSSNARARSARAASCAACTTSPPSRPGRAHRRRRAGRAARRAGLPRRSGAGARRGVAPARPGQAARPTPAPPTRPRWQNGRTDSCRLRA